MQLGQLKNDGSIYSRGDHVFDYKKGEYVELFRELDDNIIQVLFLEGEGKGKVVTMTKDIIILNKYVTDLIEEIRELRLIIYGDE